MFIIKRVFLVYCDNPLCWLSTRQKKRNEENAKHKVAWRELTERSDELYPYLLPSQVSVLS